jgi:hypothetical protein
MRCLECWRTLDADPLHIYCTGEHFVSLEEAQEIFDWLEGRYYFMIATKQRMVADDLSI